MSLQDIGRITLGLLVLLSGIQITQNNKEFNAHVSAAT